MKLIWINLPEFENQEYKKALGFLGYKVYGNLEIFRSEGHIDQWSDLMMGKADDFDWQEIFKGYDAVIQSPPAIYYAEILKTYPNAKVVIEILDSNVWYKRVKRVKDFFWWFYLLRFFKKSRQYLMMMDKIFFLLFKNDFSPISAQIKYNTFIAKVKQTVPEEQLFVIQPKLGWQPLCEFLDKPIPKEKFPSQVSSASINNTALDIVSAVLKKNTIGLALYFGTLIAIFVYLIFFY
jgi:hypothetical protein